MFNLLCQILTAHGTAILVFYISFALIYWYRHEHCTIYSIALRIANSCRVRMKSAPYRIMKEGSCTPPCNKSPGPPCSRTQTWSSSPALMVGISHQNAQATQLKRDPSCMSSGSEPNSPTRAPPIPPQQSIAGDNIVGSSSSRDLERKPNSTECQSESSLHKASQESGEAMVVDAS